MLPQDIIASRPMTEKLLGAAEIGEIYWEDVARAALRYLSEREVGVIMGFQDTGAHRMPNLLVKRKMLRALGWSYDSDTGENNSNWSLT